MKRTSSNVLAGAALMLGGCMLLAQSARDGYRAAYSDWRQTDPTLEHDAVGSPQSLVPRIAKAAVAAGRYKAARTSFLREAAHRLNLTLAPLEAIAPIDADVFNGHDLRAVTGVEAKTADTTIKAFETDKDPGIVRVRQALERERAALMALTEAQDQTMAATAKVAQASAHVEESRKVLLDSYARMDTALHDAAEDSDRESALWSDYYRKLTPPTVSAALGAK